MNLLVKPFVLMAITLAIFFRYDASSAQDRSGIYFDISVTGGLYPIIEVTTNLPDGSTLFINIKKPWLPDGAQRIAQGLAACGVDCLPATTGTNFLTGEIVVVENGRFTAGPFSFVGKPFQPGTYPIEISPSVADIKTATPEQIQAMGTILFESMIDVPGEQPER
jgi:hypothetical protein